MTLFAVLPGTIATAGVDVAGASDLAVDPPEPSTISGRPVGFTTPEDDPANAAYSTIDAVRARVVDDTGAFVKHLDKLDGLHCLDEFNTAGAGSIDMQRYFDGAATTASGVLTPDRHIIVSVGSRDVFRIVLDSEPGYRLDADGNRIDAWAGTGALGVLNTGMVFPEYGFRPEASRDRSFDYGSNPGIGGWYVAREWKKPVGKPVRKSWRWTHKKHHYPRNWPDRRADWIWWRNPDSTSVPDEFCYFMRLFTLAKPQRIKFWVCGDDTLEFQVDGEVRATAGPGDWKKPTKVSLNLSAGVHYVAAKVQNTPGSDDNQNRAGFLCSIARMKDGEVAKWIARTGDSGWKVRRQLSGPPGWFPGQILKQLVDEQVDRGCAGHSLISYGFTTATDSAKRAWVGRQDRSIEVETLGLDMVQKIVEMGVDVYMGPDLRLYAWRTRGVDRSRTVRIDQGAHAAPTDASGSAEASIRNVAYARAKSGWVSRSHAASVAARGRREVGISLGGSRSAAQTSTALGYMLPDLAAPPQTRQVSISGASGGPQPYKHFNNGDWISYRAPGATTWTRHRVMSIELTVNPAGHPDWVVSLVED